MKLTDQVCSFEQAKKLKELGVKQESLFYIIPWKASGVETNFIASLCNKGFFHCIDGEVETFDAAEYYSAFTAAELGRVVASDRFIIISQVADYSDAFKQKWDSYKHRGSSMIFNVEMLADMIIDTLTRKVMTVDEINNLLIQ